MGTRRSAKPPPPSHRAATPRHDSAAPGSHPPSSLQRPRPPVEPYPAKPRRAMIKHQDPPDPIHKRVGPHTKGLLHHQMRSLQRNPPSTP